MHGYCLDLVMEAWRNSPRTSKYCNFFPPPNQLRYSILLLHGHRHSYPPSPAHLCLLLSVFCAERPDILANVTFSTPRRRAWDVIMLLEPSQYFFASDGGSQCVHHNREILSVLMNLMNRSLSSYLTLIQRSLACISRLTSPPSRPPKFVLFDSRLHDLKLPMTKEPMEAGDADGFHQVHALPLVETYFQMTGIFEDGLLVFHEPFIQSVDSGDPQTIRLYHPLRTTRRSKILASANNYASTMLIGLPAILFCVNGWK